ncbi:MAG TPA: GntR family transcriptional regulator [Chitinophagaceae bacterium]|jgi:DNA-binding GntR family transcriptional regulator|nr:GntR family transcriptional regulator [Chitinophagaceae bacterium]
MKTDSLANRVYSDIRRKILTNQLQPGIRLKEDAWAKKSDVSRMAVREALTRLLGEKLVVVGEKGGYFVKPMTEADVHQIRELREILELGALRLAYKKITKEQIATLEKICDDFTSMAKQGYFSGACEADIKFHETLMESAGNEKLMESYQSSHIPLFHLKMGQSQLFMDDYDLTDKEHRQIVKALKSKNLKLAEETMVKHFARGEATTLA